jgi:hypothetical protein
VMAWCLSRVVSGLLHDNKANEDDEVDTDVVVEEHPDEADSEATQRLDDSHLDECANELDHVASEADNVESRIVLGTGPDNPPAVRVLTGSLVWFGLRQRQKPDPLLSWQVVTWPGPGTAGICPGRNWTVVPHSRFRLLGSNSVCQF